MITCKECKYFDPENEEEGCLNYCNLLCASVGTDAFYCGWAEKKPKPNAAEGIWKEEQALLCGVPVQVYTCSCCGERTLLRMTRYCGECGKRMRTYTLGPDD